ncbi:MAG: hypothetical protein IJ099_01085 [Alphaproteobacteria bacterium]|nr:hypothetical protein [Alphaproteobacteria bacterium]
MQLDNFYINDFIDTLCRNRYDAKGNDLAKQKLYDLLNWVSSEEFDAAARFYYTVDNFNHMATEENVDLEDYRNIEAAKKYEDFVDKSNIFPENKAALYNTLLGFIDINGGSKGWSLDVLRKKAAILQKGNDVEINLTARQTFFKRGGSKTRPVYLNIMHQLYMKMNNKTNFSYLNELGIIKKDNKIIPFTKLSPKQRLERLSVIEAIVKQQLSVEMRISLLEEGLKLANNNLRKRNENFTLKGEFCDQLQIDYMALGQAKKANEYGLQSYKWKKNADLAIEFGEQLRYKREYI